jgi:hypothetical protein
MGFNLDVICNVGGWESIVGRHLGLLLPFTISATMCIYVTRTWQRKSIVTVFLYCFVYGYIFLPVLSVLPLSDNSIAVNNNNNNNNRVRTPSDSCIVSNSVKVKQSHYRPERPWGFQEVEVPRFKANRHMKVVRLLALRTGRLYPPENIPGTHFC